MIDAVLPPPVLIAAPASLTHLVDVLAREPAVGVDTESNSLFAYRERVCLIQFSTPDQDYILDPLALDDLSALGALFANPAQQKIFHAAEYDLICLKRDYDFKFANVFDTMVAARTLGWPRLGLGAILQERFGVTMNKRFQRANWGERPLTDELLDYARLDTRYLVALREVLAAELAAGGRTEEAQEEFERQERGAGGVPLAGVDGDGANPHAFWRVNGARDLSPAQAGVLRELFLYREQQAERADRPPFKIMSDQTLVEIARVQPATLEALEPLSGMTPAQIRRHGMKLLQALRRGQAAGPLRPPHTEREPDSVRERYELLHQWRKRRALARGVESDVIVPRDALWELARRNPASTEALETIEHLGPWRRAAYGAEILALLHEQNQ
jgi:ribonuclease D